MLLLPQVIFITVFISVDTHAECTSFTRFVSKSQWLMCMSH